MSIEYKTKCHPEANGTKPLPNAQEYSMTFPLEDGNMLTVRMGKKGFDHFTQFFLDMLAGTPSYSDES